MCIKPKDSWTVSEYEFFVLKSVVMLQETWILKQPEEKEDAIQHERLWVNHFIVDWHVSTSVMA
jgi:hypothetical protein